MAPQRTCLGLLTVLISIAAPNLYLIHRGDWDKKSTSINVSEVLACDGGNRPRAYTVANDE